MTGSTVMAACKVNTAANRCAEIEDLLRIFRCETRSFRLVKAGAVDHIIQELRRSLHVRRD